MDGKTVTKDTRSQTAEDLLPNVKLFRTPRHVNRYTGACRSNLQMIFHLSERQRRGRTDRMNVQSSRGDSSSVRKTTPGRTDRMNVQIFHLSKDNAYERPIFEQFFVCLKDSAGTDADHTKVQSSKILICPNDSAGTEGPYECPIFRRFFILSLNGNAGHTSREKKVQSSKGF